MDFIKGMEIWERMCSEYRTNSKCSQCGLSWSKNRVGRECGVFIQRHPAEAMEVLKEWDKENPVKTNMTLLHEKYPDKPWRNYTNQGSCKIKICLREIPCDLCDWWQEES